MKVFFIDPFSLKEHKKASALIPEMNKEEWDDFFKNIKEVGIRQPLDINKNYEVLDGRHRLRAAKELELEKIEVREHELTEEEEMKFVRDTAVERRNLTVAQKHKIVTETDDLINSIYEEGRRNMSDAGKKVVSMDTTLKKHNTNEEIGKMIGASRATAARLNRVKKESPVEYEKVVKGEKSARRAYDELPSVQKNKNRRNAKRGDKGAEKKRPNGNLYDFKNEEVSEEEKAELLLESKNITLKNHLEQLRMFVENTENLDEVISLSVSCEKDFIKYSRVMETLQIAIQKRYGSVSK